MEQPLVRMIYPGPIPSNPVEDFYSLNISGAQRLPNGNTLICLGRRGLLFEVTPDHTIVWEYQSPVRIGTGPIEQELDIFNIPTTLFRAYRYGADYPAFEGKELLPGEPIELNPITYDCTLYDNTTAIIDKHVLVNVSILENPVVDFLKIKNDTAGDLRVEIIDISGKAITAFLSSDLLFEIDANSWAPGLYIVRFSNKATNKFHSTKIVKL